jgi:uncharacterized protein YkwD
MNDVGVIFYKSSYRLLKFICNMREYKSLPVFAVALFLSTVVFSQNWTDAQLTQANTGKDDERLSLVEKETIIYINLARLFPANFVLIELQSYPGAAGFAKPDASYKRTLVKQLKSMQPMQALYFDDDLYKSARCFAKESGTRGTVGHKRRNCAKTGSAENCSYGMSTGKDIAMQWLLDEHVAGLGHRLNCLNRSLTKIGVSTQPHKKYRICTVADFM